MTETRYRIKNFPVPAALLTDTHGTDPEPLLESLRRHAPALIALAGDFVPGLKPRPDVRVEQSRNVTALPVSRPPLCRWEITRPISPGRIWTPSAPPASLSWRTAMSRGI